MWKFLIQRWHFVKADNYARLKILVRVGKKWMNHTFVIVQVKQIWLIILFQRIINGILWKKN